MVPTERSENRVPMASTQSASVIIRLASACPCMPIGPRDSGWFSGNEPLPLKVVRTGSISVSATAWSSANADEMTVPPPARMTGFSEWSMTSIAFSTFAMSGSVHGWYPWIS